MEHIVSLFQSLSNLWKILEQPFNIFNIFSGIYGNALYVVIFTFLHKKFAKRITWCFSWNPCPFKTVKQYTSIYDVFRIEEWIITNFAKGKKSNSFSNFFNSFLFKLTVRVIPKYRGNVNYYKNVHHPIPALPVGTGSFLTIFKINQ